MAFDETLVSREQDGRFGFKEGLAPEVTLSTPAGVPTFPNSLRERLAESELEYRIQRAGTSQLDELRNAYRGARSHGERCSRYTAIAEAHEAKARRLFSTPGSREQARAAAATARELVAICEAHEAADAAGNIRVSTARSKARELSATEAHELHEELHEALRGGDPNGRIGEEFRTGGGRRFRMVYPDGSNVWVGQDDAETLYTRLHTAYNRA
jgi:hypothetical protein